MGFACWGQLGQPLQIRQPLRRSDQMRRAVPLAVSPLEKPSGLDEPKSPASGFDNPSVLQAASSRSRRRRNRSFVHPCRRAPLEAKALVPCCSSACVNEP